MTNLPGLVLMGCSALSFSLMAVVIKVLSNDMSTGEIIFFRGLFCSLLTWFALRSQGAAILGKRRGMLALRGLLGFLGLYLYCAALGRIPLADAMALQYTHPIFAALFAFLILKERMPKTGPVALLICAAGGFIILDPQGSGNLEGNLIGLASGCVAGLAYTIVRDLSKTENPLTIMLAFHAAAFVFGIALMLDGFTWPVGITWLWLAALVTFSQAGQWFLTLGLQKEMAGIATTMSYSAIAWGALLGWTVFGEPVGIPLLVGTCLMVTGLIVLTRRRY